MRSQSDDTDSMVDPRCRFGDDLVSAVQAEDAHRERSQQAHRLLGGGEASRSLGRTNDHPLAQLDPEGIADNLVDIDRADWLFRVHDDTRQSAVTAGVKRGPDEGMLLDVEMDDVTRIEDDAVLSLSIEGVTRRSTFQSGLAQFQSGLAQQAAVNPGRPRSSVRYRGLAGRKILQSAILGPFECAEQSLEFVVQ